MDFKPASIYPHHQETFIDVSAELVDEYEIFFNYSTTKDGGLVLCGGNIVEASIKQLLSKEKPIEVIPPPVAPPSNN